MLDRIGKLKKAILIEREAELKRYTSLIGEQTIAQRVSEGVTLYPIDYTNERYNTFEDLILEFRINESQDPYKFSSNGKVHLFSGNSDDKLEGVVVSFKNGVISVQLADTDLPDWIKSGKLGLNAIPDTRTSDIQLKTLERIEQGELRIAQNFYNGKEQRYSVESLTFDDFNESQNEAISQLLSSNPFHIIHGPPGTGKTRTLVKTILQMAAEGKKILVAAPSNAAVDHITSELSKHNKSVIRMGNSFKISESVLPYSLKTMVLNSPQMDVVKRLKKDSESIRKKAFKYKRNFGKEEYQERKRLKQELREIRKDIRKIEQNISSSLVKNAPIITGTFIGLQDKKISPFEFDAVFVDEAGQALEPSIWTVAHYAPKLFLAGDPLQLPPTLFTNEADKLGLSISLIEEGIQLGIPTTLLNVQYRMNDIIMQFSNKQFYNSQLRTSETVARISLPNEEHEPVEFIDTAGCGYDEKNDELGGISNAGEIEILNKRLKEIELGQNSLGVISPYRKQVGLLQETLVEQAKNCQTIDSFQGQERDLIIVSLVRSNESGTIGFLSDYRRMNVAMTRAKKKLIIIGDSATIGGDPFYQSLLDYIEQNGTYRSAWEFFE